jgi:peptide methionine sulfoxide reductase msrA/msrB
MRIWLGITGLIVLALAGCQAGKGGSAMPPPPPKEPTPESAPRAMPPLSEEEKRVILHKGTEAPFTGKYWKHAARGTYVCRQCGAPLYRSDSKFDSGCGWPSFDQELSGAVKRQPDADGRRTEILCAACGGHLGHVFLGEGLTPKDTRHCVNSVSLAFIAEKDRPSDPPMVKGGARVERAIFAGGCFWGVEHHFTHLPGVLSARSGYIGGSTTEPTYPQVCTGKTGHAEAVEVTYDPAKVTYEQLARLFFEIHDPTEVNRQGPDAGTQYRSAVFYLNDAQKQTVEKLMAELRQKGYRVATQVVPAGTFWPAEEYHQKYIDKHPERVSCHIPVKRFELPAAAR